MKRFALPHTLGSMPFRNSGIDFADGVFDGFVLVGVFAQARPTADGLTQRPGTRALASLGNGGLSDLSERPAHHQTNLVRAEQIRRNFKKLPQALNQLE